MIKRAVYRDFGYSKRVVNSYVFIYEEDLVSKELMIFTRYYIGGPMLSKSTEPMQFMRIDGDTDMVQIPGAIFMDNKLVKLNL